jgi:hypothetical protein
VQVTHGELNEQPLETFSAVAQSVFLPLLTSCSNQEGWPDVVAQEVTKNLHQFVANSKPPLVLTHMFQLQPHSAQCPFESCSHKQPASKHGVTSECRLPVVGVCDQLPRIFNAVM